MSLKKAKEILRSLHKEADIKDEGNNLLRNELALLKQDIEDLEKEADFTSKDAYARVNHLAYVLGRIQKLQHALLNDHPLDI